MTTNIPQTIATAALSIPRKEGDLISFSQGIIHSATGNAALPGVASVLASLQTAFTDYQSSETAALTRTKGTVAIRNQKRAVLVTVLKQYRAFVQSVADASPETSEAIVIGAGLAVRKPRTIKTRTFASKPGPLTGTVKLTAPHAGSRAAYEWEYSTDGGKTWVSATLTTASKAVVTGLASGTTAQFRYRAVVPKTGPTDWSAPITQVVQ